MKKNVTATFAGIVNAIADKGAKSPREARDNSARMAKLVETLSTGILVREGKKDVNVGPTHGLHLAMTLIRYQIKAGEKPALPEKYIQRYPWEKAHDALLALADEAKLDRETLLGAFGIKVRYPTPAVETPAVETPAETPVAVVEPVVEAKKGKGKGKKTA